MSHFLNDHKTISDLTNLEPSYVADTIHNITYQDVPDFNSDSYVSRIIIYHGEGGHFADVMDRDDLMMLHSIRRVNYDPVNHFK